MSQLAETIRVLTAGNLLSGRKNKAADLRVIYEGIADAVESLEATPRGSTILRGVGVPNDAVGTAGDVFVDTGAAELYFKEGTAWQPLFGLPGADIPAPTGAAHYPVQSPATTGQYLQSTGVAGNEQWTSLRMVLSFQFLNLTERHYRFFNACTIDRIEKDDGMTGLVYGVDGAPGTVLTFTDNVWTGSIPLPAGSLVVWSIVYADNVNEAYFDLQGSETIDL